MRVCVLPGRRDGQSQVCLLNISVYIRSIFSLYSVYVQCKSFALTLTFYRSITAASPPVKLINLLLILSITQLRPLM
jgi:hypothetical protein